MTSYAEELGWKAYLSFLPSPFRGRALEMASELKEESWAWRGIDIHLDRLPAPSADLKLILVHGAGGYGRIMIPLATKLGVEVIAPDLPGYGLSRVRSAGRILDYDDWTDCIVELVARERLRDPRPIVLLGGSMGGMLAYSAAAASGQVRGVIATCLLDPRSRDVVRTASRWPMLSRFALPLLRTFAFALDRVRVPIRWIVKMSKMANDPALGALCARDPLGGGSSVTLRWLRTFLASVPPVEPAEFDACPILLAHPGADSWTPLGLSLPFFDALRCDKTLITLDGAGHFPLEERPIAQLDHAVRGFLAKVRARAAA